VKAEGESKDSEKQIADALTRLSHAEGFSKRRRRPWVWVTAIVLFALAVGPAIWAFFARGSLIRIFWFIPSCIGLLLLRALLLYCKGSAICPQCHEDITSCLAAFCHGCGEKLNQGRCGKCGLDTTWAAGFNQGLVREKIRYCPGCGVFLNSHFRRYESMGD
jgi:hypothetical protein